MEDSKTTGLPVQIVSLPGSLPHAFVPLPLFQVLIALAQRGVADDKIIWETIHRFGSNADLHRDVRNLLGSPGDLHAALRATSGVTEVAIVPAIESDEKAADLAALAEARARDEESFPLTLIERLHAGEHPIKVYREHRGLTQKGLAEMVNLGGMYISQIETGRREGSTRTLRKIARALAVDLDDLTPWAQD